MPFLFTRIKLLWFGPPLPNGLRKQINNSNAHNSKNALTLEKTKHRDLKPAKNPGLNLRQQNPRPIPKFLHPKPAQNHAVNPELNPIQLPPLIEPAFRQDNRLHQRSQRLIKFLTVISIDETY